MTRLEQLWEKRRARLWQQIYDTAFCEALDKGMTLADAAVYADDRVLKRTTELMKGNA